MAKHRSVLGAAFDGGHMPGAVDGCACESGVRTWTKGEVWKFFSQFQGGGLTSEITITNTGSAPVGGWSLVFTLPGGQTITSGWNASYSPASGQMTAKNVPHNAEIAPNASVGIGFQAGHTGDTGKPTSFALNGTVCTVA